MRETCKTEHVIEGSSGLAYKVETWVDVQNMTLNMKITLLNPLAFNGEHFMFMPPLEKQTK